MTFSHKRNVLSVAIPGVGHTLLPLSKVGPQLTSARRAAKTRFGGLPTCWAGTSYRSRNPLLPLLPLLTRPYVSAARIVEAPARSTPLSARIS
jgi:hypothetical protein